MNEISKLEANGKESQFKKQQVLDISDCSDNSVKIPKCQSIGAKIQPKTEAKEPQNQAETSD